MIRIFYIHHPNVNKESSKEKIINYFGDVIWEKNNINTCDLVIIESFCGWFSKLNYHYIEIAKMLNKKISTIDFISIIPEFQIINDNNNNYCKIKITKKQQLINNIMDFNIIITNNDTRIYNKHQINNLIEYLKEFNDDLTNNDTQIIKYYNTYDESDFLQYIKDIYIV